ncbi:hypothetical protein DdX_02368 [Ditylenchus destructor]|uniref:Uncharacterized protein n=1 Tax=Ditylenchus destructor TaxID=166010 RepID=A0AAD4NHH1_9BILA|nr:hypothetical protein DdX_02368 [Ditylenchus destructor]
MNGFSIQKLFSLLLVCLFSSFAVCAQKSLPGQKGAPEFMESNPRREETNSSSSALVDEDGERNPETAFASKFNRM